MVNELRRSLFLLTLIFIALPAWSQDRTAFRDSLVGPTATVLSGAEGLPGMSCPSGFVENFQIEFGGGDTWIITWDSISGFSYEVVLIKADGWCDRQAGNATSSIIATTSQTTHTFTLDTLERVWVVFVRLAGCPEVTTRYGWALNTFTMLPAKPMLSLQGVNGDVRLNYSQGDQKSFGLEVLRSLNNGAFEELDFLSYVDYCPVGSSKTYVDDGTAKTALGMLDPGTYRYQFVARTNAGETASDIVTVTIGSVAPPTIRSFSGSPNLIRRGESSTLVWSTDDATSVMISPGLGAQPLSGSVSVSPQSTTTYTLSAVGPGGTTTSTTTIEVIVSPQVNLDSLPEPLVQGTSAGGATTTFTLTNVGGTSTTINLTQDGDFFTQSPTSFSLAPGQRQVVTVTGLTRSTGSYRGRSIPSGSGVPPGMEVPITLLATPTPAGETSATSDQIRVDVSGDVGSNPSGSVTFRNTSDVEINATASSSKPWLIPQSGIITIPPGGTAEVSFTIDRSKRPEGESGIGSDTGIITLTFRTNPSGKSGLVASGITTSNGVPVNSASASVVDTSKPPVTTGAIPAIPNGQVAFFATGVGHKKGFVGDFISDIAFFSRTGSSLTPNLQMFYLPLGNAATTAKITSVTTVPGSKPIAMADVVKTVFSEGDQVGTLQLRSPVIQNLGLNANILNVGNPDGFFGTTIPILRSDRSAGAGESFFLTDLRKSADDYTNYYLQETNGGNVTVTTEFYAADGTKTGERQDALEPFRSVQVVRGLPDGTVSAVLTANNGASGRFAAYATPVDFGGDFWAVVDWNRHFGYDGTEGRLLPNVGAVHGRNETYFRTDAGFMNTGTGQAVGMLRYVPRGGTPIDKMITLGPRQSMILKDIATDFFGIATDSLGYIIFSPESGSFVVTSRTFATIGDATATFGTGVATLDGKQLLQLGDTLRMGGIEDASAQSIDSMSPGTFRTNFALMEVSGESAKVRVTLHYTHAVSTQVALTASRSKEYTVDPNAFLLFTNIAAEILGDVRNSVSGDLTNLVAEFSVIEGDGEISVFTSSVESASGDTILRTE